MTMTLSESITVPRRCAIVRTVWFENSWRIVFWTIASVLQRKMNNMVTHQVILHGCFFALFWLTFMCHIWFRVSWTDMRNKERRKKSQICNQAHVRSSLTAPTLFFKLSAKWTVQAAPNWSNYLTIFLIIGDWDLRWVHVGCGLVD